MATQRFQEVTTSIAQTLLTVIVSSLIPSLIILTILVILYLIYKNGGEYSTRLQYLHTRTKYSFYNFIGVYFIVFILILAIHGFSLNGESIQLLFSKAKDAPIASLSSVLKNVWDFDYWIISNILLLIGTIMIYFKTWRTPRAMKRRNDRKEIKQLFKRTTRKPNDFVQVHSLILGTTGSGKTAQILRMIKENILHGRPICIVDGKGDMSDFSIYDVVSKLARLFNIPLYIVNQTDTDDTDSYNPFRDCNATQVKDMMVTLGDWSENASHYKGQASRYWQSMAQYMIDNLIPLNFENLIRYSSPSEWAEHIMNNPELDNDEDKMLSVEHRKQIVSRFGTDGLSRGRTKWLKVIIQSGDDMEKNISSFANVFEGEGRKIFGGNESFKMSDVIQNKGIAIVLLNRLSYSQFAEGMGRLVIKDIKYALGEKMMTKNSEKILTLFEEVGVYFDQELVDVVARIRSLGGCAYFSMQGVSDLDVIDPKVRRQITNNITSFIMFRQNDPEDAIAVADIIGTVETVNTTAQVEDMGTTYKGAGVGTNKITREYVFNPELIKLLPTRRGIWFNKEEKYERPFVFNVEFVDVSGIELPTKKDREYRLEHGEWA